MALAIFGVINNSRIMQTMYHRNKEAQTRELLNHQRAYEMQKYGLSPIPQKNHIPIRVVDTAGRNEPCPCGSGKKYKNCCINK
jgi:uncharacterized protein YecA (UPF0149 family)